MELGELLAKVPKHLWQLSDGLIADQRLLKRPVKGLCTNSQACQPGDLFIGMPGTRVDGGEFWPGAIASGAVAAVVSESAFQRRSPANENPDACVLPMANMALACAELAAAFHDYPARQMSLVGITGTNGKTTTSHLVEHLLRQADKPTALLGTLYARWPGHQSTASYTTPFAVDLQATLATAKAAGCTTAVMEVSSHALAQQRVWGCGFEVAVFTNLSQDHLDYHRDMEDYFAAKALLFSDDYLQGRAIINLDDPYGRRLVDRLSSDVWGYSVSQPNADLWAYDLRYQADGVVGQLQTPQGTIPFSLPLVGQFNLSNMLAAVGAALHMGIPLETIATHLATFTGVPGRMERVVASSEQNISVIVDYAHTPDSLQNALQAARPFIPERLICVFGCGGDRDRTKRPQMGRIAYNLADQIVVTSDNPRTEDPRRILDDILAGIPASLGEEQVICDRAEAIRQAIAMAQPGDGVLIAGKGHEDYQILGTEKIHFDDREQARVALAQKFPVRKNT